MTVKMIYALADELDASFVKSKTLGVTCSRLNVVSSATGMAAAAKETTKAES